MIRVMKEYDRGAKIEARRTTCIYWDETRTELRKRTDVSWQDIDTPSWNWGDFEYRVKEEPKDTVSIDDYNMIAGENKCFAEFLKKKGFSDEQINKIAYGEMT